jgi:spore germination protein KC
MNDMEMSERMNKYSLIMLLLSICCLSGCWSKAELTERGFVMGVALDQAKAGLIDLTIQIYKPTQSGSIKGGKEGISYVNVHTSDNSLFEAIRDIPLHLGRSVQWSHMRVVVIGEELAKSSDLNHLLDYFYRDHEPRLTSSILITQGRASEFLSMKPLIEKTLSQQMLRVKKAGSMLSGKSEDSTLLTLSQQLKSQTGDATIAYVYKTQYKTESETTPVAGVAMIHKGKMVNVLNSKNTEGLQLLKNQYKSGVVELPCEEKHNQMQESFEIISTHSALSLTVRGEQVTAHVKLAAEGAIGELSCSKVTTMEEEHVFDARVANEIKKQLTRTIQLLQKNKIDLINLSSILYRQDPKLWKSWKADWEERFAKISFTYDIQVSIITSGTMTGKSMD